MIRAETLFVHGFSIINFSRKWGKNLLGLQRSKIKFIYFQELRKHFPFLHPLSAIKSVRLRESFTRSSLLCSIKSLSKSRCRSFFTRITVDCCKRFMSEMILMMPKVKLSRSLKWLKWWRLKIGLEIPQDPSCFINPSTLFTSSRDF
jgi:hypothetical protein